MRCNDARFARERVYVQAFMSRYILAHIELPIEIFNDGTHKIHNDRSNIYFESLGRLPPLQQNTQIDLGQLLNLSSQSPQQSIPKVSLEEMEDGDEAIVFRSITTPCNADTTPVYDNENNVSDGLSDETDKSEHNTVKEEEEEDLGKVLEKQYVVYKHEILPRRPKSERYTFKQRPKHKSSLYSRKVYA